MSKSLEQDLSGVPETLLIPLYNRAMESRRPDAIIRDERAVELVTKMGLDFSRVKQVRMTRMLGVMRIIFAREFDRYAREYLARHPDAVVVHIGCGLDTRFERVDDGRVEWYDLDVPKVIDFRRQLLGRDAERYHLLGCSVLDDAWMKAVKARNPCSILFLAETVFLYFTEEQVRSLVLALHNRFPGAELVFDAWKPFEIWIGNRYLSNSAFAGLMRWGVWSGREIEDWGTPSTLRQSEELRAGGIRLLDEWSYFDRPEPRLNAYRWTAPLFRIFRPIRIFHFKLGKSANGEKGTTP
jgi:O-methyltransferase involved in polyketide biosynthesis